MTLAGETPTGSSFGASVGIPWMGFIERLAIAIGFQWIIVLSIILMRKDNLITAGK